MGEEASRSKARRLLLASSVLATSRRPCGHFQGQPTAVPSPGGPRPEPDKDSPSGAVPALSPAEQRLAGGGKGGPVFSSEHVGYSCFPNAGGGGLRRILSVPLEPGPCQPHPGQDCGPKRGLCRVWRPRAAWRGPGQPVPGARGHPLCV